MQTPAEACAALAALIAGADGIGTLEESRFLSEDMASHPVFDGMDGSGVVSLVSEMTQWLWASFPSAGGRVTDDAVTDLLGLMRTALPEALRPGAYQAAVELAQCDGMSPEEERLLARVREGLDL